MRLKMRYKAETKFYVQQNAVSGMCLPAAGACDLIRLLRGVWFKHRCCLLCSSPLWYL